MPDNLLTSITELEARLNALQVRRRRAASEETRVRRQIVTSNRQLQAQIKFTLGAALLRAIESDPAALDGLRRLLGPHITRPTDIACLAATPFRMDEAT